MIFVTLLLAALYFVVVGIVFTAFEYFFQAQSSIDGDYIMYSLIIGLLWPITLPITGGSLIAYELIDYFFNQEEETTATETKPSE